jgi:hypothetical protein
MVLCSKWLARRTRPVLNPKIWLNMGLFTIRKCLQYYLPVALTLFMGVTIQRTVVTDGGYDRLYGLPFPYISNSYVSSMSYDIYVLTMILNLLFCFAITVAVLAFIEMKGAKLKDRLAILVLGIAITSFWIVTFALMTRDSSFYFVNHTEFKTTSRELIFGLKP